MYPAQYVLGAIIGLTAGVLLAGGLFIRRTSTTHRYASDWITAVISMGLMGFIGLMTGGALVTVLNLIRVIFD